MNHHDLCMAYCLFRNNTYILYRSRRWEVPCSAFSKKIRDDERMFDCLIGWLVG